MSAENRVKFCTSQHSIVSQTSVGVSPSRTTEVPAFPREQPNVARYGIVSSRVFSLICSLVTSNSSVTIVVRLKAAVAHVTSYTISKHDTGFKIQDDVDRLLDCTRSLLDDMGLEEGVEAFQQKTPEPLLRQGGGSVPLASGDNSEYGGVDPRSTPGLANEPPSKATTSTDEGAGDAMDTSGFGE